MILGFLCQVFVPILGLFSNGNESQYFHFKNAGRDRNIQLQTTFMGGSSGIHSKFFQTFLTGQFIDNDMKSSVSNQLDFRANTIGFDWNTEISYTNINDTSLGKNWGMHFAIKNRMFGDVKFDKSLFDLIFYGNAPFVNQTVDLRSTSAELTLYQQFELGVVKTHYQNDEYHQFGLSISFLNGNSRLSANSNLLQIFTEQNGNYIDLSGDINLFRTLPEYSYFLSNNGSGFSVDVCYNGKIGKSHYLNLGITDLGFIGWQRPQDFVTIDSSLHYSGVDFSNILTSTGNEFQNFLDTINEQYIDYRKNILGVRSVPFNFSFNYTNEVVINKLYLSAGLNFRNLSSYTPYIYAKGAYYIIPSIVTAISVGYGGFAKFNVGLDLGFHFGKGWQVVLATKNLESIVPNTFGRGASLSFQFNKFF